MIHQTSPAVQPPPLARRAATLSWILFLLALAVSALGRGLGLRLVADFLILLFLLTGFSAAVFALAGIKRHGRKGILLPALAGLVLNGLFLLVWITNFVAVRERAQSSSRSDRAVPVLDYQG